MFLGLLIKCAFRKVRGMGLLNIGKLRGEYRERVQPADRKRFGTMERHKDYVLRARDFHKKERQIKKLRLAASMRNPDEFDREMAHSRVKDGEHVSAPRREDRGGKRAAAKRENIEDLRHLTMARTHQAKVVQRLKSDSALAVGSSKGVRGKRVVFLGDDEEAASKDQGRENDFRGEDVVKRIAAEERKLKELDVEISRLQLRRNILGDSQTPRVKEQVFRDVFGDEDKTRVPVYRWMPQRKR